MPGVGVVAVVREEPALVEGEVGIDVNWQRRFSFRD